MEKRKKKHGIYNPEKENPIQSIKIAAKNPKSSREEKENWQIDFPIVVVIWWLLGGKKAIPIVVVIQWVLNPKGGNWMFWWGKKLFTWRNY